jgi:hypothetical protein
VSADAQTPSRTVGAGGYQLRADVGPSSASADGTTGAQSPGGNVGLMEANAHIAPVDNGVEAAAFSDIQSLTVGPLTLLGVHSEASAIDDQTGNLVKHSSFHVDAARIGSGPIGLAPNGFMVAGTPVPADGPKSLNDMLASSGISLDQFPATETPDGITGAGLVIKQKFTAPQYGATTVSYRVGGVAVRLQGSGLPVTGTSPHAAVATPAALPGSLPLPPAGSGLTGAAALPAVPPAPIGGPAGGSPPASEPLPRVEFATPAVAARPLNTVDSNGIYLAIVAAGVLGLGVLRAIRTSG